MAVCDSARLLLMQFYNSEGSGEMANLLQRRDQTYRPISCHLCSSTGSEPRSAVKRTVFTATSASIRCRTSMPPHFPSSNPPQHHRTGTAPSSDFPRERPTDVRPRPILQRQQRYESAGYAPSLDVPLGHHCASTAPSSPPDGPLALRRQLPLLPLRSWKRNCNNVSRDTRPTQQD